MVTKLTLLQDDEMCRVERAREVNVFPTAGEAYRWAAHRTEEACDDSDLCNKHAYTVSFRYVSTEA